MVICVVSVQFLQDLTDFEEKTVPQFINLIVKLLKDNGGTYLVGNGVRWLLGLADN